MGMSGREGNQIETTSPNEKLLPIRTDARTLSLSGDYQGPYSRAYQSYWEIVNIPLTEVSDHDKLSATQ
jgi:hypothetical protein